MAKTAPATPPVVASPPAPASTPEKRVRTIVNGVRIPAAEYEYDLAGPSRAKTRFKGMDGVVFDVFDEAACVSGSMAAVIRSKDPSMPADYAYPLSNVQSGVLETVLEYCYFHASTARAAISDDDADEWDDEFASLDPRHLCELASAAYYLDIKALVDLTCKTIAGMISGKSADEIRSTFCIENDMDGDFLGVLPSEWYSSTGPARGRFRSRMLTVERQARRLNKARELRAAALSPQPENEPIATASVEEIMNYIDGGKANGSQKGKRRRGKKKRAQSPSRNGTHGDDSNNQENGTPANGSETTSPPSTPRSRPPAIEPKLVEEEEEKERLNHDRNKKELVTSPTTPEQKGTRPGVSETIEKTESASADTAPPSTAPSENRNAKSAKQRGRKKDRKRSGAASHAVERASSAESAASRESNRAKQTFGDEFDEEALHHMDEEVEAFRRTIIMAGNEAHEKKRATLELKLKEMQSRAEAIEAQMAVLAKEREVVRDGLARTQIELANIPPKTNNALSTLYTAELS